MVRIGARVVGLWALLALAMAGPATAAGGLPDGRAYELVSPAAKNGVEVIPQTDKHQLTADGNAVTFSALGGFGSLEGSSFDFEYLARRTGEPGTSGWGTIGINPLARPATFAAANGNSSSFVNGFTSDLSVGIYATWRPMVDAPNVAAISNLYRITGLDGRTRRTVQLMTDSVTPIPDSWSTLFGGFFVKQVFPRFAGVSSDLRHVVFESTVQLTADAPPYQDPFCVFLGAGCPTELYENADGVVQLVGRIPQSPDTSCDDAGAPVCVAAPSSQAALSATGRLYSQVAVSQDGRRIYFQMPADVPSGALYLREDGERTDQVAANGKFWTASADGSRAFFTTNDSLLSTDTDSSPDLYMYDRTAPAGSRLTLVSTGTAPIDGYVETVIGSSPDGHYVYFVCDGQMIAGEPPADIMGLYVWHDGQLRYIGHFQDINEAGADSQRNVWAFVATARKSRISLDGRHLLFATTSDAGFAGRGGFTGYDHAGRYELYLYDADTGRLACASCNPSGRAATADSLIDVRDSAATSASTSDSAQALTDDGRRAFFNTAEALVPEDTNARPDAYEYDAQTGRVQLLSAGKSTSASYFVDATPDGSDAFIVTRQRLLGWDVDDSYDLYDVRVGGGFPEPPTPASPCTGESCLPAATTAPTTTPAGSTTYKGTGDTRAKLKRHHRSRCAHKSAHRTARAKHRCTKRRARKHRRRSG